MKLYPVVFIRFRPTTRRISGLLIAARSDGTAVVYAQGRTQVLHRTALSRARYGAAARVIGARLRAEYVAIEALTAPLLRRRRGGLL